MAVRLFDLSEPQSSPLEVVQAPTRRQHIRRVKQRYAIIAIFALAVPFFAALVALGVAH